MTRPAIRIGKQGITKNIIEEIKKQLLTTDPLTIKLLQNFREANDRKEAANTIASHTKSRVQSLTGGTLVLTRKNNKQSNTGDS